MRYNNTKSKTKKPTNRFGKHNERVVTCLIIENVQLIFSTNYNKKHRQCKRYHEGVFVDLPQGTVPTDQLNGTSESPGVQYNSNLHIHGGVRAEKC